MQPFETNCGGGIRSPAVGHCKFIGKLGFQDEGLDPPLREIPPNLPHVHFAIITAPHHLLRSHLNKYLNHTRKNLDIQKTFLF